MDNTRYVIKLESGEFVHVEDNTLKYIVCAIVDAQHYRKDEIEIIYKKFLSTWVQRNFLVYEKSRVILKRAKNWF